MTTRRPFTFDPETRITTRRTRWRSGLDTATEEEARIWHAVHRRLCAPPVRPEERPSATVPQLRRSVPGG
ncbi:hypothetical protein [Streptomyces sp. FH025]|uniref:hypothetical protein n=1 Tax=Streptomyces sp. FH025 TaxID=2815937 RepID=UPI001A9FFFA7|nr:hypothetical protein [Streptomyces sp. FH025]MBO1416209.1 hypothetical protein [Streptomyces sp. FH025]